MAVDPSFSGRIYLSFSRCERNVGKRPTLVTDMLGTSVIRYIREAANRFVRADQGNIAVMFAIACIPLISFVGAAVDYSRLNAARSAMQSALDSTALMVSKDLTSGVITTSQISATAQSYFSALYTGKDAMVNPVTAAYTAGSGSTTSTVVVTGSGSIVTQFMRVAGFPSLGFGTSSTATWGNVKMRVALALDNTGSMSANGKIGALKTAVAGTGGLIEQLSALEKTPGDVYISIIPFAKTVNVGASNYSQNWIDWTDWLNPPTTQPANAILSSGSLQAALPINWHAVGPGAKCPFTNASGGFTCQTSPTSNTNVATIQSTTLTLNGATIQNPICPSVDANSHTRYNGCWESKPATPSTGVFCTGSSQCSCPRDSSNNNVAGCSCTGSGSGKSCTGNLYVHNWSQPGSTAVVGFANAGSPGTPASPVPNQWTATSSNLVLVPNNWTQASSNPINTWTGCVTDRTQPNDATGVLPTSGLTTQFPANQYYENSTAYCDSSVSTPLQPIIPLSYTWSTLKTAINTMQPTGGTNQAIGLAWAWQTLLQNSPVPAPAEDANTTYNRVIILLSDGLNTEDRWPQYGDGSTQNGTYIDDRQALLCSNLNNARDARNTPMYTIYTIQVNTHVPADPTSTVLQNCASSPDKFFMLTSSGQIATTFNTIGTALSKLRVAR
jgi:Flp pilus assembly protein TadG